MNWRRVIKLRKLVKEAKLALVKDSWPDITLQTKLQTSFGVLLYTKAIKSSPVPTMPHSESGIPRREPRLILSPCFLTKLHFLEMTKKLKALQKLQSKSQTVQKVDVFVSTRMDGLLWDVKMVLWKFLIISLTLDTVNWWTKIKRKSVMLSFHQTEDYSL